MLAVIAGSPPGRSRSRRGGRGADPAPRRPRQHQRRPAARGRRRGASRPPGAGRPAVLAAVSAAAGVQPVPHRAVPLAADRLERRRRDRRPAARRRPDRRRARASAAAGRGRWSTQERQDLASIQGLGALVADGEDAGLRAAGHRVRAHPPARPRRLPLRGRAAATTRSCRSSTATAQVRWGPTPWETARWGLPTDGAVIPVWSHGVRRGRFVLTAPVGLPMSTAPAGQGRGAGRPGRRVARRHRSGVSRHHRTRPLRPPVSATGAGPGRRRRAAAARPDRLPAQAQAARTPAAQRRDGAPAARQAHRAGRVRLRQPLVERLRHRGDPPRPRARSSGWPPSRSWCRSRWPWSWCSGS